MMWGKKNEPEAAPKTPPRDSGFASINACRRAINMMDNVPNEAKNKARDLLDQSEEELNNGNRDKAKQLHHSARHLSGIPEDAWHQELDVHLAQKWRTEQSGI